MILAGIVVIAPLIHYRADLQAAGCPAPAGKGCSLASSCHTRPGTNADADRIKMDIGLADTQRVPGSSSASRVGYSGVLL